MGLVPADHDLGGGGQTFAPADMELEEAGTRQASPDKLDVPPEKKQRAVVGAVARAEEDATGIEASSLLGTVVRIGSSLGLSQYSLDPEVVAQLRQLRTHPYGGARSATGAGSKGKGVSASRRT